MKRTMIQRMGKSTAALLLAAAVSVGFLQGAMTQPVSAEAAELSDFEAVFDAYSTKRNVWDDFFNWPKPEPVAAADFTKYWTVNADGMLESTGGGKLNLLYTKEKYTDFTMTFRYKHGPDEKNAAHLYVGIGAPESGATLGANGKLLDPSPTVLRIYQAGNYQYAPKPDGKDDWYGPGYLFKDDTSKNAVHTVTISVTRSTMTMTVDGQSLGALALTNYEGGHIFFGAGMTVDAIGLPEITAPTNDFDGFSSYYTERVGSDKLASAELTNYWIEDEGAISRDAQAVSGSNEGEWNETANHLNNMAYLFIEGEYTDYENYTVELDYTMGSGAWRRAYIGFGATENVTWREENGGSVFFTDGGGATCFEGNLVENGTVTKGWNGTTLESFNADASHHLKLTVQDGRIIFEVDGQQVQNLEYKDYYAGGRIFLASNSTGTVFRNIKITEIASQYTNNFEGYTSYYSPDIASDSEDAEPLTEADPADYWTEKDGVITRKEAPSSGDAMDGMYMAALFADGRYENFELEVDVLPGTNNWRRALIGIGAEEKGKHFHQAGGGLAIFLDNGVRGAAICKCGNITNFDGKFSRDGWGESYEGTSLDTAHHLRLVLKDRILTIYFDDCETPTVFMMPDWYDGGYIYFAANSTGAAFSNIQIREIEGDTPAGDTDSHLYGKGALFIGDSICFGVGDTPEGRGWAQRIGFKYDMDWINAAHGGATIAQDPDVVNIPGQLDYDYLEGRTIDYVIIEGGINDAARNSNSAADCPLGEISDSTNPEDFDQTTFAGALEALLYNVKTQYPEAKVGFLTTYQVDWIPSGPYMELAKEICDKWDVPYLDLYGDAAVNEQLAAGGMQSDGLHMNAAGYEIVTPLVEEFMLEISHTYDQQVVDAKYQKSEATCTQKAQYYYSCVCGKAGESTFESGETLPHTPAEKWSSDDNGHWHACTACGTKVDEAAHNPGAAATEDTPQTCTVCGYELAPATGHVNHVADTSKWLHDGTQHWHKCQRCDEKMDAAAHSGGEATCEGKAVCAVCGVEYGELADHSYEDWVIVREATETANGLKERTCTVCGEKESEEIPATGETPDTNPEPGDKIPQTGENVPWIVLATAILASVVSVGSLLIQRKRKQKGI